MKNIITLSIFIIMISLSSTLQALDIQSFPPVEVQTTILMTELTGDEVLIPTHNTNPTLTFNNPKNEPHRIVFSDESGQVIKKVFTNGMHIHLNHKDFGSGKLNYQVYRGSTSVKAGSLLIK